MPVIGLLGRFFLRIDDRDAGRLSKKGQALLAYLALNRGGAIGRERLADLLWPDHDSDHARHSLRNCLLQLRTGLGPATEAWLVADGDGLRLEPGAVEVDVDRFLGLARSSDVADLGAAAQLYRGELLADLSVSSEPFDAWIAPERARLLAAACELYQRLAAAQEAAGQVDLAIAAARRLVALERFSEEGHRLLMRLLAQSGRRAQAISLYRGFVATLREELGVGPDAETDALAKRIQSAEVGRAGGSAVRGGRPVPSSGSIASEVPDSALPVRVHPAVDAGAELKWPDLVDLEIGVAPFRNLTGDDSNDLLMEGFTEDLLTDLTMSSRRLSVSLAPANPIESPLPTKRGDLQYLIVGSMQPALNVHRLNIRILDVQGGKYIWARRFEGDKNQLMGGQTGLSAQLLRELHIQLFRRAGNLALPEGQVNLDPAEFMRSGVEWLKATNTPATVREAQLSFLRAFALDGSSIEGLLGLAQTYQLLHSQPWWSAPIRPRDAFDLGSQAVASALALDPQNIRANLYDGFLLSGAGRVEQADAAVDKALAIDPTNPGALAFRAYNRAFMGRAEQGLPDLQVAMNTNFGDSQLRERRLSIYFFYAGMANVLLGKLDEGLNFLKKSLDINPLYGSAHLWLSAAQSLRNREHGAAETMMLFRKQWPTYRLTAFDQQWVSRSTSSVYRNQVQVVFASLRDLGLPD